MLIKNKIIKLLILINCFNYINSGNVLLKNIIFSVPSYSFKLIKFIYKYRKSSLLLGISGYYHKETFDELKKVDFQKLKESENISQFIQLAGKEILKTGANITFNISKSFFNDIIEKNKEIIAIGTGGIINKCLWNMQNGYNKAQQNKLKMFVGPKAQQNKANLYKFNENTKTEFEKILIEKNKNKSFNKQLPKFLNFLINKIPK